MSAGLRRFLLSPRRAIGLNAAHGLARASPLAQRQFPGHRVERLESDRLGRQRGVLLAVPDPMVRHRKAEAGRRAGLVLVVEPGRVLADPVLRHFLPARFGVYLCECLQLDPLSAESRDSPADGGGAANVRAVWGGLAGRSQFLRALRNRAGIAGGGLSGRSLRASWAARELVRGPARARAPVWCWRRRDRTSRRPGENPGDRRRTG